MNTSCLKEFLLLMLLIPSSLSAQNPLEEIVEAIESRQMLRLAAQQSRHDVTINRFKSDECGGGMSSAWSYLADTVPKFTDYVGNEPPWEHCCVTHDRQYWRGVSDDGYAMREQSDTQLRQCVQLSGKSHSKQISAELGLAEQDIAELINLTSDLMHQAVRIGGAPCTGLPWRWGHGWPPCSEDLEIVDHLLVANHISRTIMEIPSTDFGP
jgi:hypothetical protein